MEQVIVNNGLSFFLFCVDSEMNGLADSVSAWCSQLSNKQWRANHGTTGTMGYIGFTLLTVFNDTFIFMDFMKQEDVTNLTSVHSENKQ